CEGVGGLRHRPSPAVAGWLRWAGALRPRRRGHVTAILGGVAREPAKPVAAQLGQVAAEKVAARAARARGRNHRVLLPSPSHVSASFTYQPYDIRPVAHAGSLSRRPTAAIRFPVL